MSTHKLAAGVVATVFVGGGVFAASPAFAGPLPYDDSEYTVIDEGGRERQVFSGEAMSGSIGSRSSCTEGLVADISLSAFTWVDTPYVAGGYVIDAPRTGGTATVVAVDGDGAETTVGSWTLPDAGRIETLADFQPYLASLPAAPSLVLPPDIAGSPYPADGDVRDDVAWSPTVGVFEQQVRAIFPGHTGTATWTLPADTAHAWVQADPSSPWASSPDVGYPDPADLGQSIWYVRWAPALPDGTERAVLRFERTDGTLEEASSPVEPISAGACKFGLEPHVVTVPVGETASVDLLGGSHFSGEENAWQKPAATIDLAQDVDGVLGLGVDGATLTTTPTVAGTYRLAYGASVASRPEPMTATSTVTIVATEDAVELPALTVPDRTVELRVGDELDVDLLDGVTFDGDVNTLEVSAWSAATDLVDATGWSRNGRAVSLAPVRAGAWEVEVQAFDPVTWAVGAGTLTIVVTEPEAVVPEPVVPEPETPVVDGPQEPVVPVVPEEPPTEPEVVLPPVVDEPEQPDDPQEPVVPVFATGLPVTGTSPLRGVGLGLMVAGLGVGAVAVARRGRADG